MLIRVVCFPIDYLAKTIGLINVSGQTNAGFTSNVATILSTAALGTAFAGTPSHDSSEDTFSCQIKCNDANGEWYTVTIKSDTITISSYESASILSTISLCEPLHFFGSILSIKGKT
jgi:hypothetical protein